MNLVKTQLCTQLKHTNFENCLPVLTESQKEGFNGTVFQHFVNELKHQFQYYCVYVQYMLC